MCDEATNTLDAITYKRPWAAGPLPHTLRQTHLQLHAERPPPYAPRPLLFQKFEVTAVTPHTASRVHSSLHATLPTRYREKIVTGPNDALQ